MKKLIEKILLYLLSKVTKTESLNSMFNELQSFAANYNENYISIHIEKQTYEEHIKIRAYINRIGSEEGKTLKECISKMKERTDGSKLKNPTKDILIN